MEKLLTLLINYGMANLAAQQCLKFMALNVDKRKCYLNANFLENVLSQVKYLFDLNWLHTFISLKLKYITYKNRQQICI